MYWKILSMKIVRVRGAHWLDQKFRGWFRFKFWKAVGSDEAGIQQESVYNPFKVFDWSTFQRGGPTSSSHWSHLFRRRWALKCYWLFTFVKEAERSVFKTSICSFKKKSSLDFGMIGWEASASLNHWLEVCATEAGVTSDWTTRLKKAGFLPAGTNAAFPRGNRSDGGAAASAVWIDGLACEQGALEGGEAYAHVLNTGRQCLLSEQILFVLSVWSGQSWDYLI